MRVQPQGGRLDRASGRRTRNTPRGRGGDRGAALVEFAIISPLIFALLIGLFTGGIALSHKNAMTSAVREGARFGATLSESGTWANDTRARVIALAPDDLTTSQVCVQLVKAPATIRQQSTAPDCSAAMLALAPSLAGIPAGDCAVLVWARRTTEIEFVLGSKSLTLDARSVSKYERACA
jgi:Flp pilus assembly protein TadG